MKLFCGAAISGLRSPGLRFRADQEVVRTCWGCKKMPSMSATYMRDYRAQVAARAVDGGLLPFQRQFVAAVWRMTFGFSDDQFHRLVS